MNLPDRETLDSIRDERADAVASRNWTYDDADSFYREGWDDAIAFIAGDRLESITYSKWSNTQNAYVPHELAPARQLNEEGDNGKI